MNRARPEVSDQVAAGATHAAGVFVLGMFESGVELLGRALTELGLDPLVQPDSAASQRLTDLNERLLVANLGQAEHLPAASPLDLARSLAPWFDEAAQVMVSARGSESSEPGARPWVWAEPRLSFLASFWSEVMDVCPVVILVHRDPFQVESAGAGVERTEAERADIVDRWDRYNRAALVLTSRFPSLAVSWKELVGQPKATLAEVVGCLGGLGMTVKGDLDRAVHYIEGHTPRADLPMPTEQSSVKQQHLVLDKLLDEQGRQSSLRGTDGGSMGRLVDLTADFYDEAYYGPSYDQGGVPYARGESAWTDFFDSVARVIVRTLRPRSVLDVGCALGMLVEALRERGIDARGMDISRWAIQQVPPELQPFCWVGSVTDEIDGHYDLITCTEVLEHLPASLAEASVANLCRHADAILFSSTPDDFDEPTHLNVEPHGYWATLFLRQGFVRDFGFDASFVAPHAMLFRRTPIDSERLVDGYEMALWKANSSLRQAREEAARLGERMSEAEREGGVRRQLEQEMALLKETLRTSELRRAAEGSASFEKVREYESGQRRLAGMLSVREGELEALQNTKTFRYTAPLRSLYGKLRGRQVATTRAPVPAQLPEGTYQTWIELFDTLDESGRRHLESRLGAMTHRPKISVIMPVFNPPVDMLRQAIDSVRGQIYPNWELCMADDCSTDPEVLRALEEAVAGDARIKVIRRDENGHISAASNSALTLATGEIIAPLDHDDVLAEHALALVALAVCDRPDVGIVYSDEDKLDQFGQRSAPFFKPDFDPLLLLGQNFVSHFSAFRKDLVDRVGGYRVGYEGSQDWDLTLRISEHLLPNQVVHIPHVLYHWRVHSASTASRVTAKPYAVDAGQRAVMDHLARTGRPAQVTRIGQWGFNRVSWAVPDPAPRVSIVIPTQDGRLLQRCIDSVLAFTLYPDFEVVIVDNSSRTLPTLEYLSSEEHRLTVLRDDRPFNHSAMINEAVARTSGDVVCLLNDNTEVITGEWLSEMVGHLSQPGVGAVGAKLYYGDGRIEHAGIILGVHGVAGHAHRNYDRLATGYYGHLQLPHRMSAVTAACMLIRRQAWEQVHGFDEQALPNALKDVDLCLRLREEGWDIVWTPYAELFHHEPPTKRGLEDEAPDADTYARAVTYMETRWGFHGLRRDPYYNPNLSLDSEDFSLAWPPRVSYSESGSGGSTY